MSINRRTVLLGAAGAAGLSAFRPLRAALGEPFGFQIFSVRDEALKDFAGTMRRIAGYGYSTVELVSFKGYADASTRGGFGPLAAIPAADLRKQINDAGLGVEACHFKFEELDGEQLGPTVEWAHTLGLKYAVLADFPMNYAEEQFRPLWANINRIGENLARAGLKMGYHTSHLSAFNRVDGAMVLDTMLRNVDARHIAIQLDLMSTLTNGVDPAMILDRFGSRIYSVHLRDGATPDKKQTYVYALPLGQGDIDWKRLLAAAKRANIRNFVVEMPVGPNAKIDPLAALRLSADYLKASDF